MNLEQQTHIALPYEELFELVEHRVRELTGKNLKITDHSSECRAVDGKGVVFIVFKAEEKDQ